MSDSSTSQTLDRGLRALHLIATATEPFSIDELGRRLEVGRSVVYRLVRTLEAHDTIERDPDGRLQPGPRLAQWGDTAHDALSDAAREQLPPLADALAMTAFVVVPDGDEALTIHTAEPSRSDVHLAYRPGHRHRLTVGAPGLAILAGGPPVAGERDEIREARDRGWASSAGEVIPGMASVAAPIRRGHGDTAENAGAVAVVYLAAMTPDVDLLAAKVTACAERISRQLRAG